MIEADVGAGSPEPAPDRSTLIRVFGGLQLGLGGIAALMIPLGVLGLIMQRFTETGMSLRLQLLTVAKMVVLYSGFAALFVWTGVGLLKLRRWARDVSLVISVLWLVIGVVAVVKLAVMFPTMMQAMESQMSQPDARVNPAAAKAIRDIALIASILISGIFYLVIPGTMAYFYSRGSVRRTLLARDPAPAWTDACPLPVMGMAAFFLFGALSSLTGAIGGVLPICGTVLGGWLASLGCLVGAAVLVWLAYGFYRLRTAAWCFSLVWLLAGGASTAYTFSRIGIEALYEKLGVSGEYLDRLMRMAPSGPFLVWSSVAVTVLSVAYILYLKRFFRRSAEDVRGL